MEMSRKEALEWWKSIDVNEQIMHWTVYRKDHFSPSSDPFGLTGREIEIIHTKLKQNNEKLSKTNSETI